MAKPEWGEKHRCTHCATVFYDMQRKPIICPGCDKVHHPESLLKSRRSRAEDKAGARAAAAKAVKEKEEATESEDVLVDDDDDDLPEDVSELAEDDEDIPDVAPGRSEEEKG